MFRVPCFVCAVASVKHECHWRTFNSLPYHSSLVNMMNHEFLLLSGPCLSGSDSKPLTLGETQVRYNAVMQERDDVLKALSTVDIVFT